MSEVCFPDDLDNPENIREFVKQAIAHLTELTMETEARVERIQADLSALNEWLCTELERLWKQPDALDKESGGDEHD